MFLNGGVPDSKSNIVDASTKVVPHMTKEMFFDEGGFDFLIAARRHTNPFFFGYI